MNTHGTEFVDAVSYTATRKIDKGNSLQRAFSVLLFTVFVVVDLLALSAGASSYGSLTKMQNTNDARVMAMGPIISSVRANDAKGSVGRSKDAPEGEALVLTQKDEVGTYETRIYLYQGKIMQEFALANAPYTPQKATALANSSTFAFSYDKGVLTITTDAGQCKIALRNQQGGA